MANCIIPKNCNVCHYSCRCQSYYGGKGCNFNGEINKESFLKKVLNFFQK